MSAGGAAKWLRLAVLALVFLLPLVVFPGLSRPFSTPKIFLLEAFVVITGIYAVSLGLFSRPILPSGFLFSMLIWAFALIVSAAFGEFVSQQAFWLSLFSMGWFLLVVALRPNAVYMAAAISMACAAVAVIVLLQYSGLDPFGLLGWTLNQQGGSPRMRIVGTLGNPNFAAALLVSGMPIALALGNIYKRQGVFYIIIALEALAVLATGSKAGVIAGLTALLWLSGLIRLEHRRWIAAGAAAIIIMSVFMPSRSLLTTIEGRFYIWRVTASHLLERPFFGFGPGSFAPKYIEWETLYWQNGHGNDNERKFAQLQAHAHNDYLETLVDNGIAGLLGFVSLLLTFFVFAFRQARQAGNELVAGASAGVVALAVVTLVDFPLHRPAELFFFWTLMSVAYLVCMPSEAFPTTKTV